MRLISLLFSFFISIQLHAETRTKEEIQHLLMYVKTTKCIYIRNGDEYSGKKAQSHIQRKYNYFEDDIKTAEDFIRLSATESTMFHNKYYIKCPDEEKVESATWLLRELKTYRSTHEGEE